MATRLKSKKKETDVQFKICEYLEERGRCFFRMNNIPAFNRGVGGAITMRRLPRFTPRGLPDIVVIVGGLFYALEVKKPAPNKTYQSKDQKIFEENVKKHGGYYFVVRSVEEVQKIGL